MKLIPSFSSRDQKFSKTQASRATMTAALACVLASPANAGLDDLVSGFSSDVERQGALAVLQTYNNLIETAGCSDELRSDPGTGADGQGAACSGQVFTLFSNVRKLIHTANEITNEGSTEFSLGVDVQSLARALRWNAAEEYAAQGSLSSDFVKGQVSGLSTRLSALRMGAAGFSLGNIAHGNTLYAGQSRASGGGASADNYSPWGGFINYAQGSGTRAPTLREDAFDFDGAEVTAGVDYRINNQWVFGALVGVIDQDIDFDGALSVVEGGVTSEGYSVMPFAMYQTDNAYVSASLGYQQLSFTSERAIRYASLNPNVASVNTRARSETDARIWSGFVEAGYTWQASQWAVEPFVNARYADVLVDGFIEEDINNAAFDLAIDKQALDSLEYAAGINLRYTLTPTIGVITPFVTLEQIRQTKTDSRAIGARYANALDAAPAFNLATDKLDGDYNAVTIGVASVLRGARQRVGDGALAGGVQAFISFKRLYSLEDYEIDALTLGLRYEF